MFSRVTLFIIGWALLGSGSLVADLREGFRKWTNHEGKTLEAKLSHIDGDSVYLIMKDGREASVLLTDLGKEDRNHLDRLQEQGLTFEILPMPGETSIETMIEVTGGPDVFFTPHFEFSNTQPVSRGFVMEAARVFEGTHEAVKSLPLGLEIRPPGDASHFRTSFLTGAEFSRLLVRDTAHGDQENVAGIYIMRQKKVFVPYEQLGVQRNGSQLSLRKGSDTSTLIHEITHQLMHEWLPLMPLWLAEGTAEYLAAVPYQNGRFEFRNAEKGLINRLVQRGSTSGAEMMLPNPAEFLAMNPREWQVRSEDYASALAYVYFFMHLDRPEAPGAPLAAYLRLLGQAKDETHELISEYNKAVKDYNARIETYNDSVVSFKKKFELFQESAQAYNERVVVYNAQVKSGVDPEERVVVGAEPNAPDVPQPPRVPEILERNRLNGPIDIFTAANRRALPSLLRGRSYRELADEMVREYRKIGLTVLFDES